MDRRKFALLEALKTGALENAEVRLYRRGKLPGLFAQRTRGNAEIANQAVKDGLLEVTRVETVGKTAVEWVRVTPKGLDFLLESESPARALEEVREALAVNQDALPIWAGQMHARLGELSKSFQAEVEAMRQQLDRLARRVNEAIDRLDAARATASTPSAAPWAQDAHEYLERREQVGLGPRCPLADLFATLKGKQAELTVKDFHAGLRRLHESGGIALLPSAGNGDAPGPEYALLDGATVYYYVERGGLK